MWGGRRSLIAHNVLGGGGELPAALGRALGPRARTGCRVTALRPDGAELLVDYVERGQARRVRARHAIVAAQAPFAARLVEPVAGEAAAALARMTYGAFVTVAVETREDAAMPWDHVYAMATPGRAFDMFTNQAHTLRASGERRPGGSLMLFAGARHAAALAAESDAVITERFLADLHTLFPRSRGVIADASVHRWELGNVYAHPGRHRLQPAARGRARPAPEPPPGRRLLRRAGEPGGRRGDGRGRRRARRRTTPRTPAAGRRAGLTRPRGREHPCPIAPTSTGSSPP